MSARLPGLKYKSVFERGRVVKGRLFTAWILSGEGAGRQAGVVVSKKSFHDAVDRNRAKRILREGFRLLRDEMPEGCDWVLVGRSSLAGKRTADVMGELRWCSRKYSSSSSAPTKSRSAPCSADAAGSSPAVRTT
ncbi:MAG: ribonuclease P protein component [Kiritimatiellae bacterium]|nr:ribonuclease P protein component [Kiritimatiellia bacterium]